MSAPSLCEMPSVLLSEAETLPAVSAVYVVTDVTGDVLYVGRAKNLQKRWVAHHRAVQLAAYLGAKISWAAYPIADLEEAEAATYLALSPKLNKARPSSGESRGRFGMSTVYVPRFAFEVMASADLSGLEYRLLLLLIGSMNSSGKVELSQGEMAKRLSTYQPAISKAMRRLKSESFVLDARGLVGCRVSAHLAWKVRGSKERRTAQRIDPSLTRPEYRTKYWSECVALNQSALA